MHRRVLPVTGGAGQIMRETSQPNGQPRRCLDVSRAERAFGFWAVTLFELGLRNSVDWYLSSSHSEETL